jgi:DNA-3-methyladenine glycosylase I
MTTNGGSQWSMISACSRISAWKAFSRALAAHHPGKAREFPDGFRGVRFPQGGDERDVERLLSDAGIVRHRGKIEAIINNAGRACEMTETEGSLAAFLWRFEPVPDSTPPHGRSTSPASEALSKDLRKRGWKFVGPTTVYAFMQAIGLINDHAEDCIMRQDVEWARANMRRPS